MAPTSSAIDGVHLLTRLDELAKISESPTMLRRLFLTDEHRRANALVGQWMVDAGMNARTDAIGNIIGHYEADHPDAPVLMVGSHLDTVSDAGRYDGMLGVVSAIAAVGDLQRRGKRFPFAVEVVGFADEEGLRFGATLIGSRAIAGTFDIGLLSNRDQDGVRMSEALTVFGLDPAAIGKAARNRAETLAYIELHIEQGPVLEAQGLSVGCVTAINGATRFGITINGQAGHAGTVPMDRRRDALAATAACILAIEKIANQFDDVVATVGVIKSAPGAVNVISGQTYFTLDLRAPEDAKRRDADLEIRKRLADIADARNVSLEIVQTHEGRAARCAPWLMKQINDAMTAEKLPLFQLPSGAGHDGMAMIELTDIAMIFVRCAGGVSHNPAEAITAEDAEIGTRVLLRFIENFKARP